MSDMFQMRRIDTTLTVELQTIHVYCYFCHQPVSSTAAQVPVFYDFFPGVVMDGQLYTSVRSQAHEECVDERRLEEVEP